MPMISSPTRPKSSGRCRPHSTTASDLPANCSEQPPPIRHACGGYRSVRDTSKRPLSAAGHRGRPGRAIFCRSARSGSLVRPRAKEVGVGLFTINFELGDKTLETLTRIADTSVLRFELGPETRAMIERLASSEENGGTSVGGLVKKGVDALRST